MVKCTRTIDGWSCGEVITCVFQPFCFWCKVGTLMGSVITLNDCSVQLCDPCRRSSMFGKKPAMVVMSLDYEAICVLINKIINLAGLHRWLLVPTTPILSVTQTSCHHLVGSNSGHWTHQCVRFGSHPLSETRQTGPVLTTESDKLAKVSAAGLSKQHWHVAASMYVCVILLVCM